jgi:hypothetical protein
MRRPTDRFMVVCIILSLTWEATALPWFTSGIPASHEGGSSESGDSRRGFYEVLSHDTAGVGLPAIYADPPVLPVPPSATISEGGGWLSRWLAMGGEGEVNVVVSLTYT